MFGQDLVHRGVYERTVKAWRIPTTVAILSAISSPLGAAAPESAPSAAAIREAVAAHRRAHEAAILTELPDLIALPNVASDRPGIRKNALHLKTLLEKRGLTARLLEQPPHPPVVYGELATPGARSTVVFYAHYDGQPVEADRWASTPYKAVLLSDRRDRGKRLPWRAIRKGVQPNWRLYGRSSSDDKGPIIAGVVYGVYRYTMVFDGVASQGLSERLFLREDGRWVIAVTTAFDTYDPAP